MVSTKRLKKKSLYRAFFLLVGGTAVPLPVALITPFALPLANPLPFNKGSASTFFANVLTVSFLRSISSSPDSSASDLSSFAILYTTNRYALRRRQNNQKRLRAWSAANSPKTITFEIQHLYCCVSQLSS